MRLTPSRDESCHLPPSSKPGSGRPATNFEPGAARPTGMPANGDLMRERRLRPCALPPTASANGAAVARRLVLVSEGIDYDVTDAVGRADQPSEAGSINQEMREAVAAASRTNASIYTIDPRGLAQNTADTLGAGALDRQASDGLRKELLMSQASLREIAQTTGGLATVNANDLSPFFNRIVEDTSTYYMVSYSPGPDARPGYVPQARSAGEVEWRTRAGSPGIHVRRRVRSRPPPICPPVQSRRRPRLYPHHHQHQHLLRPSALVSA